MFFPIIISCRKCLRKKSPQRASVCQACGWRLRESQTTFSSGLTGHDSTVSDREPYSVDRKYSNATHCTHKQQCFVLHSEGTLLITLSVISHEQNAVGRSWSISLKHLHKLLFKQHEDNYYSFKPLYFGT